MDLNLRQKSALVSGAHRGTGLVIAQTLLSEGTRVALHGFSKQEALDAENSLKEKNHDAGLLFPVWGDITTDEGATQVYEQSIACLNQVDILVNNYGTALSGKWQKSNVDQWHEAMNKNLYSAVRLINLCIPNMRQQQWGRIIQLSTIGDHQPNSIMPHYYAAKAALSNTTVSLAKELSSTGITVNTVSPGFIHTPEMEALYHAKAIKKGWPTDWDSILEKIVETDFPNPTGRIATREDVANLVVFLCSPLADFINGQNIRVDGGAIRYV